MTRLSIALLATTLLVSPVFAGEAFAEDQGYTYVEEDSPEGQKFEKAIKQTAQQGHSLESIQNGFRLNGWDIDTTTIQRILSGGLSGHKALKQGLITPTSAVDESVQDGTIQNGPTQYTGTASYGGGGSSYSGGSVSMGSIPGMACGGGQAAAAGLGAVGAIAGWFSGGRATAPLQMAQQVQLYTANACLFSQLQAQLRSLWTQMQNLKNTDLATINGTLSALYRVRSLLGSVDGTVYQVNRVTAQMGITYPDEMSAMTGKQLNEQSIIWKEESRNSIEESWKIQAQLIQNQREIERRTSDQVASLNRAPGIVAAQQATGNLITTLIEKTTGMETASISHYRAVENGMLKEEADKAKLEEEQKKRLMGWGDTTGETSPLYQ